MMEKHAKRIIAGLITALMFVSFLPKNPIALAKEENEAVSEPVIPGLALSASLEETEPTAVNDTENVTDENDISDDTTIIDVFGEAGTCTVSFYDVSPDGTVGDPVTRSVAVGTCLADITDVTLADGTNASVCVWRTAPDGEAVNGAAYTVSGDTALYTLSHRLVLHYAPAPLTMARSVTVTPGENGALTITVTAREGEPLAPSDFIIDGVDYSLYHWTVDDGNGGTQELNLSALIESGLTDSITANSTGEAASVEVTPTAGHPVDFYVFLDGERVLLDTRTLTSYRIWDPTAWSQSGGGNWRYYLLVQTLSDVYGDFGFTENDLSDDTRCFPNASHTNPNTIWADSAIRTIDGRVFIPLGVRVEETDVYYLPKHSLGNSGPWENYKTAESFYSITMSDPNGLVYTEGTLPEPSYTLNGETAIVTVSNTALDATQNVVWTCTAANGTEVTGTDNGDGTSTFTVPSIDQPYTLTAYPPSNLTPEDGHRVNFYLFIDDQRVLEEARMPVTAYIGEGNRRYLTAKLLEEVYGVYGFRASDMTVGTRYFPHTDANGQTIWANTSVLEENGKTYSPIITHKKNATDVYYLPFQTLTTSAQWDTRKSTESFYSLTVSDPEGLVYTAGDLPAITYTLRGQTASATVSGTPREEGLSVEWSCAGLTTGTAVAGTPDGSGNLTFVIENITEPYVIHAEMPGNAHRVTYNIDRPHPPVDEEFGCPTVQGEDIYSEYTAEGAETYRVLAPNPLSYFYRIYRNGTLDNHIGKATFLGWAVNGDTEPEHLVQPGEELTLADYPLRSINLTAQWEAKHANAQNKTNAMVNFYVSLAARPLGPTTTWSGDITAAHYTNSVYTDDCGVEAGIVASKHLYDRQISTGGSNQYIVLGGMDGTNINESHAEIHGYLTQGYTLRSSVDGEDYTFKLSFPTDEHVLNRVRQMIRQGENITINGHRVTESEMNTDNFSVRWYVFKYDVSDGWHVDGVLVAKPGTLRVTKTFEGDPQAIERILANGYSITVTGDAGQDGIMHTGATLTPETAVHEEGTNDYTWEVLGDLYYRYTVTENNYLPSLAKSTPIRTTAEYMIVDSVAGQETFNWLPYPENGIKLLGESPRPNSDEDLMLKLRNTYTTADTLVLRKIDAASGRSLAGVSFSLRNGEDEAEWLYDLGNSRYVVNPPNDPEIEPTLTTTVVTDSNGQAFLTLLPGTYLLTEDVPTGYNDPGVITLVVDRDAQTHSAVLVSATAENEEDYDYIDADTEAMSVTVKNRAPLVPVKVKKIWADGMDTSVVIRLYHEDEALRTAVTLDGETDAIETAPWECVFEGLPLYVDGGPAQYNIREEQINGFHYSADYEPDGYRYFEVEYSKLLRLDENGDPTEDIDATRSMELTVTNRRDEGRMFIYKVDENGDPLPGAVFRLYHAEEFGDTPPEIDGARLDGTAVSDEHGVVDFGVVHDGDYLVEYEAPEGYERTNTVYRLKNSEGILTMEYWDGTEWISQPDHRVVNYPIANTDVEIEKRVVGLIGDHEKQFGFTVTCDAPMAEGEGYTLSDGGLTATFSLSHGESVILKDVLIGSALAVAEDAEGYTMTVKVGTETAEGAITVSDGMQIRVNNAKDVIPDAGVLLDSLPYVLILAAVGVAAVLLILRKRRDRDKD